VILLSVLIRLTILLLGVADAIAEFIDNSLQATQRNEEGRNINLDFDLDFYSKSSYLVITDNGKGMTELEIQKFAKYGDPKYPNTAEQDHSELDTSSEQDPSNDPTNISMFGVGSKEAGFYLGDTIHIITKSKSSEKVIEFVLDEKEMEEKHHNNQDVTKTLHCLLASPIPPCPVL
jgi:structural maintenance of chromosomes flexible hinge domain-containing protein 1